MNSMRNLLASALLITAFSCSGGGGSNPPTPAARLTYTDPGDTTQWRLTRNAASTATHLVLDLMAPTGASGRGVSVVLTCDAKAAWKAVNGSAFTQNVAYTGDLVQKGSVQGSDLRVLLSQRPGTAQSYGSSPVLSVAMDLVSGTLPGTVAVSAAQGAHLGSAAAPESITVVAGTLKAE
jgi:hypothetical protein